DDALALRRSNDHLCIKSDQRRRRIRRIYGYATVGIEDGVLAVQARRCILIANVAAGAITRPAAPVIPATRILGHVAADRALIANLGRGCRLSRTWKDTELLPNHSVTNHFGERGHRANLEPIARRTHAAQLIDLAQIDDHL